jgi:hypothetical protein
LYNIHNGIMIIKTKLTRQDFINTNFIVLYSKPAIRLFTVVVSLAFIFSTLSAMLSGRISLVEIVLPLIMLCILPLIIYFNAGRVYASSRMSQAIEYTFDDNYFTLKGETFNGHMSWDKIYKVTKTRNWLLIWQNKYIASPIPKRDSTDEEMKVIKEILKKNKVRNNL